MAPFWTFLLLSELPPADLARQEPTAAKPLAVAGNPLAVAGPKSRQFTPKAFLVFEEGLVGGLQLFEFV